MSRTGYVTYYSYNSHDRSSPKWTVTREKEVKIYMPKFSALRKQKENVRVERARVQIPFPVDTY